MSFARRKPRTYYYFTKTVEEVSGQFLRLPMLWELAACQHDYAIIFSRIDYVELFIKHLHYIMHVSLFSSLYIEQHGWDNRMLMLLKELAVYLNGSVIC